MDGLLCITISRPNGEPIGIDRWTELIEKDPELLPIEFAEGMNPRTGECVRIPYKEPAAIWTAHPEGYTTPPFVFAYRGGVIKALNVDRPFVGKGKEIARRLDADMVEMLD